MSIDKVRMHLKQSGLDGRIIQLGVSSATVDLAAQALGVGRACIVKTLSFQRAGEGCILVLAAGDARVDNQKFKAQFGVKARMLTSDEASRLTGHQVGGVCPFGVEPGARVYLDRSIARFDKVYPGAGSDSAMVALTVEELEACSGYERWVDVCKDWTP